MFALQQCKFRKNIDIRYFTGSDQLAIEKLDHIKEWAKLPYFKSLLDGADTNNKTELKFGGNQRIYVQGYGGKARGGHPDFIILDDIIDSAVIYSEDANKKSKERLAMEILPMAEPHTKIIIIGTIQKDNDLYSVDWKNDLNEDKYFTKTYDAIVDEEKHITLFPEKWSWERLMAKKKEITELAGTKWFDKEYRNMATNLLGEIIKPEWYREYEILPEQLDVYTGWDLAVGKDVDTGDWTAKVTIGVDADENVYILDVYKDRIDFGKRIKAISYEADKDKPIRVAIEENVFQADTVQVAKQNCDYNVIGVKTTINKVQKYNEQLVPLFESGRIYFKKGDIKQQELWRELCSLPRGAHDDMSDALCIALKDVLVKSRPRIEFF